ncbi:flagellar hook basal-body protein [Simkania negevensis]|uniref:Flagellar hook basal-body protein n=1 Tax=Simkania negevensis TaxID=83561 RepID=A0ABS3AQT4_9BACT|nr:flagellar hook basal-body protein [Simkania negevensis]
MLVGFYTGVSGAYYNEQKLAVTSNNLANANTTAFKRNVMVFRTRLEEDDTWRIDPSVKKRLPSFYGVEREGVFQDMGAKGPMVSTGNPMDLSINTNLENAFFKVKRDVNDPTISWTRNGSLGIGLLNPSNPDSPSILTAAGSIILGDNDQPIEIDPLAGELNITPEGIVQQGKLVIGTLPLYRFDKSQNPLIKQNSNLQSLMRLGNSLYQVPPELAREFNPERIVPGEGGVTHLVTQGAQEGSNVKVINEMISLINVSKAATSNVQAMRLQVTGLQKLFQIVRQGA